MSKLITTRYEMVVYDDAAGVLAPANQLPPTYPPVLDSYSTNTVASAGNSYGTYSVISQSSYFVNVPAGAQLTIVAPASNANPFFIRNEVNSVASPGAAPSASAFFFVAPGQTVTYPGVLVQAGIRPQLVGCDNTMFVSGTATFSATILWSL